MIAENDKNLDEALTEHNITVEEFNNITKNGWETLFKSLVGLSEGKDTVTIESVESL